MMKLLIVNDDGIQSPGLRCLAELALKLGDVWIAAPSNECSCMSRRFSGLNAIKVTEVEYPINVKCAWSIEGTPVDCVKQAISNLMDCKPDYVFSGINNGWNLGFDCAYSGTVGATMEASFNGINSIAFSNPMYYNFNLAQEWLLPITKELISEGQNPGEIWNVNFPECTSESLKGIVRNCVPAHASMYTYNYSMTRISDNTSIFTPSMGITSFNDFAEGSDIHAIMNGFISIGKIQSEVFR